MLKGGNVTKAEAEKAIRSLASEWHNEVQGADREDPSFSVFELWLKQNGYGNYLVFRSRTSPREDAERWFIDELKQGWRY